MAEREVVHLQNDGADADDVRRWMATITGDNEGIVAAGDLAVTEKSGTPNMSVDVAAGRALIKGTTTPGTQGTYFVENDATVNLAITAADPTNPRIDKIVAQVRDGFYGGGINDWVLAVVTGTPAASPVAPSIPASSLDLADVSVAALATSIVDANITDNRTQWHRETDADALPQRVASTADVGSLTSTIVDVTGATITVNPPRAGMTYAILGTFYFKIGSATTDTALEGHLAVDGTREAQRAQFAVAGAATNGEATITQVWLVTVAGTGPTVFKLQAAKTQGDGAGSILSSDDTGIAIVSVSG